MKKARILFVIAIIFFSTTYGFSQGKFGKDSVECIKNLGLYEDYAKSGNYAEAAPFWREALKLCPPAARQSMYIRGVEIMSYLIDNTKDPQLKASRIDSLLKLYDIRIEYFPKYTESALAYKLSQVIKYFPDDDKKIMDQFNVLVDKCGNNTDNQSLVFAMNKTFEMYKKNKATGDDVLNMYSRLTPMIEYQIKNNYDQAKEAKAQIDYIFANSGVASCENIVKLFGPKFKETPTDKDLVSRIVRLLSDTQCFQEDLYIQAVEELYKIDPSYRSAYSLSKLYAFRKDFTNAMKFLQEAIESPESSDTEKGDYYIEMASYCAGQDRYAKSVEAARMAMQKNPALSGKAYLMIGSIWGMLKCGGNEIESRAHFWVAVDYLMKARAADSSLASDADKYIAQFSKFFPLQEEAFMYDINDGNSYTVSCGGMSATTTVRTRK